MFDPISKALLDEINKYARAQRTGKDAYWISCPACGKRVVKKELIKKGCYVCEWQGTEEEIEGAMERALVVGDSASPYSATQERPASYRTNCPRCNTLVVRAELLKNGCYRCGRKLERSQVATNCELQR